jgi:hypothetical protein
MPALPPVPNVVEILLMYTEAEDIHTLNRWFVAYGGTAPTATQLTAFAVNVQTVWLSDLGPQTNANTSNTECICTDLSSPTGAVGVSAVALAGSKSGVPLSAAASCVISQQILRRYRGGHPRVYLPGRTQSDLSDSQRWSGAFISAIGTAWQNFVQGVVTDPWSGGAPLRQVSVSRYFGFTNYTTPSGREKSRPTPRLVPLVDTVVAYRVNPKVGSQRRRNQQGV